MAAQALVQTVENYLRILRKSKLVEDQTLERALKEYREAIPSGKRNIGNLSDFLIEKEIISDWHQAKLATGKYKGFFLGKYKLIYRLGAGGMSTVYLAEHTLMQRQVAIKILPQARVNDRSYLERFYVEARATAALDHDNIVKAYNIDNEGNVHYLVMEYVPGHDLQKLVETDGPLSYADAANYIYQAACGLAHAHKQKMIHRDIKPANLLLDPEGIIKILDMGLARMTGRDEEDYSITVKHDERVIGTTDYLAPEQAVDSHTVDHRADIYSLGGTFYFLLVGTAPFPTGTLAERLMKHQTQDPVSIFAARVDAPNDLVKICKKMMAKKPKERFQDMDQVQAALRNWLETNGVEISHATIDTRSIASSQTQLSNKPAVPPPLKKKNTTKKKKKTSQTVKSSQVVIPVEEEENEEFFFDPNASESESDYYEEEYYEEEADTEDFLNSISEPLIDTSPKKSKSSEGETSYPSYTPRKQSFVGSTAFVMMVMIGGIFLLAGLALLANRQDDPAPQQSNPRGRLNTRPLTTPNPSRSGNNNRGGLGSFPQNR